jgi:anti-sigma regulatory factor (Ser/Thr protein kinase)
VSFDHVALFYDGDREYLAGTLPLLRAGAAAGDPMLVAVAPQRVALLRDALGADADAVAFVDMEQLGRNPGRIIGAWGAFADANADAPHLRGIGEPAWPGRSDAELCECHRHESLLNLAFAGTPSFDLICPYDVAGLPAADVEAARRTHPAVVAGGERIISHAYVAPERGPGPFEGELRPPATEPAELPFGAGDLAVARRFAAEHGRLAGLDAQRRSDLVLAVAELVANTVRYGGGHGRLRAWLEDHALLCEVRDDGFLSDPLAGRRRPPDSAPGGRGLWMVNHLCDLVQIRSRAGAGNVVRLHMALGSGSDAPRAA